MGNVTITPTVAEPTSTIRVSVNGGTYTTITSGSISSLLAMNLPINSITTEVKAQDGTIKTYTISVNIAALPVTWVSFTATKQANNVYLQWLTANEVNNDFFNVQHSTDGSNGWSTNGKVNAGIGNYSFVHASPVIGSNYYRLQQVDKDGKTSYSEVRMVQFGSSTASIVTLYPNPIIGNSFTIDYGTTITEPVAYFIYDANGKLVKQGKLAKKVQIITVATIAQGRYVVKLGDGTALQFVK
jgi:hypothetical protein